MSRFVQNAIASATKFKKLSIGRDTGILIPGMGFRNESIGVIELRNTPIAIIIDGPITGISANNQYHLTLFSIFLWDSTIERHTSFGNLLYRNLQKNIITLTTGPLSSVFSVLFQMHLVSYSQSHWAIRLRFYVYSTMSRQYSYEKHQHRCNRYVSVLLHSNRLPFNLALPFF